MAIKEIAGWLYEQINQILLHDICRMIKIEHSIFALPYASGRFVSFAADGMPDFKTVYCIDCRNGRYQVFCHDLQSYCGPRI